MNTTEQKYIKKLKKARFLLADYIYDRISFNDLIVVLGKLDEEIKSLEQQIQEETITDADIEAWAKKQFDPISDKLGEKRSPLNIKQVRMFRIKSSIEGAKAMRNGEIKHIENGDK